VEELVVEYKQKAVGGHIQDIRRRETDLRSVCSQETEDSGLESMLPKKQASKYTPLRRKHVEPVSEEINQGGFSRESSVSRQPLSKQGTITSSLQQNLSQSTSRSSKENTRSRVDRAEAAPVVHDKHGMENKKSRKRKGIESPAVLARKRRSGEGTRREGALRERNQ